MAPALILFGSIVFLAGLMIPPGMLPLALATAGTIIINQGLNILLWRWDKRYLAYKFFATYYVYCPIFFFFFIVLYPDAPDPSLEMTSLLKSPPYSLFYSYCLVPLGAVVFARFMQSVSEARRSPAINYAGLQIRPGDSPFRLPKLGADFEIVLIVSALVNFSIWITTLRTNIFMTAMQALYRALSLMPFVAGLYWSRSQVVRWVWLIQNGVSLLFGVVTGNRGYAFFTVAYYGLGYLLQQPTRWRRIVMSSSAVVAGVMLTFLGGITGTLREEFGRTDIQSMQISAVLRSLNTAVQEGISNRKEEMDGGKYVDGLWVGLDRIIDWTHVMAPNMSPSQVPYRGYGDYSEELMAMMAVPSVGLFPNRLYYSRGFANLYGFNVFDERDAQGAIASHSVPFGIVADSWSRGGIISMVAQVGVALVLLTLAEYLWMRYFLPRNMTLFIVVRTVVIGMSCTFLIGYTMSETIRQVIVMAPVALVAVAPIVYLVRGGLGQDMQQPGPGTQPMPARRPPLGRAPAPRRV